MKYDRQEALEIIKQAIKDGCRYFLKDNGDGMSDEELSEVAESCTKAKP